MRVEPDAALIRALCNQSLTMKEALCELIDNSLDAGATTISVTFGPKNQGVTVEDDGRGASDLSVFARLGHRHDHQSTQSGCYGVGAKDAALWLGGERSSLYVRSVRDGICRHLTVDWHHMMENDWDIMEPTEAKAGPNDSNGTSITIKPMERRISHWDKLLAEVAYTFTPAIKRGCQIKFRTKRRGSKPQILERWQLPKLKPDSIVDRRITVGGKSARVYAGIVESGVYNDKPGITYMHGLRVIIPATHRGCGSANTRRIAGFVDLGNDRRWGRTKNKNGIVNDRGLYEAVEEVLRPVLEQAEQEGSELRHRAFTQSIQAQLNAVLTAKEKRSPGESQGTNEPKGTKKRRRRADKEQPGDSIYSRRGKAGAVKIDWGHMESDLPGRITGSAVELNRDNPLMRYVYESENAAAAVVVAMQIIADDHVRGRNRTLKLPGIGEDSDFLRVMGRLMSSPIEVDGRKLHAVPDAAE